MAPVDRDCDVAFVGGGLAATLLLRGLRPFPDRVVIVDPHPPPARPPVHWSYWSRGRTLYDRFAVGSWYRASVAGAPPEPIAPFALRLVRSTDVLASLDRALEGLPVERIRARATAVRPLPDGRYEVETGEGTVRARWVFDSARDVAPAFPSGDRPSAVLSGTGLRVEADRPVFDAGTATLFDPLDGRSFAYLLPMSPTEALVESASFGPRGVGEDRAPLLRYLSERAPEASFVVKHAEYGDIPLGFAPARTAGPRHVLLGAKRGLVKPSAGYGVVRIAEDCERLAGLWEEGRPLPTSLLGRVMTAIPLAHSLAFISEELSVGRLGPLLRSAAPVVFGRR